MNYYSQLLSKSCNGMIESDTDYLALLIAQSATSVFPHRRYVIPIDP